MDLKPRLSRDGELSPTSRGWRLAIPAGPAHRYRLTQLDDHLGIARRTYPWRVPVTLSLRARASSTSLPGTWGFGFWNDPFGFSFGPGEGFLRLPALPNCAWFFFGSPQNYLSFRDDLPARGLLAQAFRSPRFHPLLFRAGITLPLSRTVSRQILSRVIDEDATTVPADPAQWHTYRLQWTALKTTFWVDGIPVLESPVSPMPPLGFVLWIDNQYAAFTPEGKLRWGLEVNPESAWLEVEELDIHPS